jgi:hypothetical protein
MYHDHKTRKDRMEPNDWYITPMLVLAGTLCALTLGIEIYGADRTIELLASWF